MKDQNAIVSRTATTWIIRSCEYKDCTGEEIAATGGLPTVIDSDGMVLAADRAIM